MLICMCVLIWPEDDLGNAKTCCLFISLYFSYMFYDNCSTLLLYFFIVPKGMTKTKTKLCLLYTWRTNKIEYSRRLTSFQPMFDDLLTISHVPPEDTFTHSFML